MSPRRGAPNDATPPDRPLTHFLRLDARFMDVLDAALADAVLDPTALSDAEVAAAFSPLSPAQTAAIDDWSFDAHQYAEDELLSLALTCFLRLSVYASLRIPEPTMKRFLLAVKRHYHPNPYHNFVHAVDVLQATYYILTRITGAELPTLSPLQRFGLLLAAYTHDIGHPGCNNVFMSRARTALSQVYGDKSTLENFHVMVLFRLLAPTIQPYLPPETLSAFKAFVQEGILATDMALHFDFMARFEGATLPWDPSLLACCILKCADISNTGRPWRVANQWVDVLIEEYQDQGNAERSMGLPIHRFGDPRTFSVPTLQVEFISAFVMPLYGQLVRAIPEARVLRDGVERNLLRWRNVVDGVAGRDDPD